MMFCYCGQAFEVHRFIICYFVHFHSKCLTMNPYASHSPEKGPQVKL